MEQNNNDQYNREQQQYQQQYGNTSQGNYNSSGEQYNQGYQNGKKGQAGNYSGGQPYAPYGGQPQGQQYGQPYYKPMPDTSVMSRGAWLCTMLLMLIPIANFVLLLVWAFSDSGNVNRKNWSQAVLIMMLIGIGLTIVMSIVFAALAVSVLEGMKGFQVY